MAGEGRAAAPEAPRPARPAGWIPRLNFRHLQLLVQLQALGSISDTARAMGTTQPALSKWLKELEDEVGAALFDRHARGLTATAHGDALLTHAHRMLYEMGRAREQLDALQDGGARRVLLGAAPASITQAVPLAVAAFLRRHPGGRVDVREDTMSRLLEALDQGALDAVVGVLDDYSPRPGLRSEPLYREPMRILVRRGHPLAGRARLDWPDLLASEWILWPRGTNNRRRLDHAIVQAGLEPLPCRVESSSLLANATLVRESDLLCAVSARLADWFDGRGDVVALDFPADVANTIGVVWREQPLQLASTLDMLACLREAARPARERPTLRRPEEPSA